MAAAVIAAVAAVAALAAAAAVVRAAASFAEPEAVVSWGPLIPPIL